MDVGVGLPTGVPGTAGREVTAWAREIEQAGFASVAVLDRIVYDSYEPLVSLAAAAAVTERVTLATTILIAPLRNTALLAKQLASVDRLSGGRLAVGVGVGARADDYAIAGVDMRHRGRVLADALIDIPELFAGGRLGLGTGGGSGPRFLAGGTTGAALARMARHCVGYIHGGGPPRVFARAAAEARAAWLDAGRPGTPQLWGQAYFAFGSGAGAGAEYLRDYYGFTGSFADKIASGLLTSPRQAIDLMQAYAEAGCSHLIMLPAAARREQLQLLAEASRDAALDPDPRHEGDNESPAMASGPGVETRS